MSEGEGKGASEAERGLEGRLRRLEEIVRALDSGEAPLEEGLKLFQEGVGHIRVAEELLRTAELQVEELLGESGTETSPLPGASADGGAGSSSLPGGPQG